MSQIKLSTLWSNLGRVLPFVLLLIIALSFALPVDAYTPIVPIPDGKGGNIPTINTDDFGKILNLFYQGLIGICGILAVGTIIWGGLQYIFFAGDSASKISEAKSRIKRAVIGLILVLISVPLLNTINPTLLDLHFAAPAVKIDAAQTPNLNDVITNPGGINNVPGGDCYTPAPPDANAGVPQCGLTHEDCIAMAGQYPERCTGSSNNTTAVAARATLASAHIGVNRTNECTPAQNEAAFQNHTPGPCTDIVGLPNLSKVTALKTSFCTSCDITITGGAELGHVTHGPNLPRIDLSKNGTLDTKIRQGTPLPSGHACGIASAPAFSSSGYTFVDEGNHWHVCY